MKLMNITQIQISIFIKNRTCLRIRKTDNENTELASKGKSNDSLERYAKIENNLDISINSYDILKICYFPSDATVIVLLIKLE